MTRGYVLPTTAVKEEPQGEYVFPVYSSQTKDEGLMGYYNQYLYENAITWTTDGANAGTVHFRDGKFYCTNVCGVLLNENGNANRCIAEILGSISKKYVSYVGNPKLMNNVMSEIRIHIPSVSEQKKIDELISTLDLRITKQRELIEHLKKYKRGLLLSFLGNAKWEEILMQDVATGFDYGMNSAATAYDGKHKYIRITDIDESTHRYNTTDCVSPSDIPEPKYKVRVNDILFARTGASVGKSYIYDIGDGDLYYAGFLIRASVKHEFNSYFIYLNTLTPDYQKWVLLESTRSGQPGINAEQYRRYSFRCPPIDIQNKIANIFLRYDSKIQHEQHILDCLSKFKQGILQNIFA